MASRGGFTGPPMNPNVHPMNVGHAAGMRMAGMPQTPIGYPRSMNNAPQYPQVGFLLLKFYLLNQETWYTLMVRATLSDLILLWRLKVCFLCCF